MYKTILCAIEASPEGKKVLAKAVKLAEFYGAKICVVNVLPYTLLPNDYQKKLTSEISPKIEKIHSKKGLRSAIGSTATGVANNASCDVTLFRL